MLFLAGCNQEPTSEATGKTETTWVVAKRYEQEESLKTSNSDKWAGFRNLKWGTNIKAMNDPNMILVEKGNELTIYRSLDDKLSIGNAELSSLLYTCFQDRFCAVMIETKKWSNFAHLRDAVFAYYGEGYKQNEFIDEWMWNSRLPTGPKNVMMGLEYNKFSEEGKLGIFYQPIWEELENADAKAAKEAGIDF